MLQSAKLELQLLECAESEGIGCAPTSDCSRLGFWKPEVKIG